MGNIIEGVELLFSSNIYVLNQQILHYMFSHPTTKNYVFVIAYFFLRHFHSQTWLILEPSTNKYDKCVNLFHNTSAGLPCLPPRWVYSIVLGKWNAKSCWTTKINFCKRSMFLLLHKWRHCLSMYSIVNDGNACKILLSFKCIML